MKTKVSSIIICIATIGLSLFISSCTKDGIEQYSYCFTNEGGPLLYELNINGASISLFSSGIEADKPIFIEDNTNPDEGQWFTELDWIRVYYTPFTRNLFISVDKNLSGLVRKATIVCYGNDKTTKISLTQMN